MSFKRIAAAMLGGALLLGSYSSVAAGEKTVLMNTLETGGVRITLAQLAVSEEGTIEFFHEAEGLLPGDHVSLIPQVTVEGESCYLRMQYEFSDEEVGEILENTVYGMGDEWVKKEDGYYYYKAPLETGEHVELFHGFQLPNDFPQSLEEHSFTAAFKAEAIQSENFSPDFDAEYPWGMVKIQKAAEIGTTNLAVCASAQSVPLEIIYQGDSKELIANQEDFFVGFDTWMPGDFCEDAAVVQNHSDRKVKLYFSQRCSYPTDLLKQMKLEIVWEQNGVTNKIFSGNLGEETENLVLAELPGNTSGELRFSLEMPAELDNDYAWLEEKVQWIFSNDEIIPPTKTGIVSTGDRNDLVIPLMAGGLGVVCLCLLLGMKESNLVNSQELF